jgi:hypothetical protein
VLSVVAPSASMTSGRNASILARIRALKSTRSTPTLPL